MDPIEEVMRSLYGQNLSPQENQRLRAASGMAGYEIPENVDFKNISNEDWDQYKKNGQDVMDEIGTPEQQDKMTDPMYVGMSQARYGNPDEIRRKKEDYINELAIKYAANLPGRGMGSVPQNTKNINYNANQMAAIPAMQSPIPPQEKLSNGWYLANGQRFNPGPKDYLSQIEKQKLSNSKINFPR